MNNSSEYSVLMSVYYKEKPDNLRESIKSIYSQSVKSDDFILVCDGPLTKELDDVIHECKTDCLKVIRLNENSGLGNALNIGMKYCKHDLVARMDSDDISFPDRCAKELQILEHNPEIGLVSGNILEFNGNIDNVIGKRLVPECDREIRKFSKRRNPFNHPAVMFRKADVIKAGGYSEEYPLLEDYYLWIRMLINGTKCYNIQSDILYMRTSDELYARRGKQNTKSLYRFYSWMLKMKWCNNIDILLGAIPQIVLSILPNALRTMVYKSVRR